MSDIDILKKELKNLEESKIHAEEASKRSALRFQEQLDHIRKSIKETQEEIQKKHFISSRMALLKGRVGYIEAADKKSFETGAYMAFDIFYEDFVE